MNQKQLQYFVTVYQTQNIKTAADTLYVSRQGVSKVIRLLEEELGQPLFIRSIKGVIPTDYATTLLPHAKSFWRNTMPSAASARWQLSPKAWSPFMRSIMYSPISAPS